MRIVRAALVSLVFTISAMGQVSTGIDVLEQQNFAQLRPLAARHDGHLRLGILTNPVGIDAHERRTIDVLHQDAPTAVPGLSVVTLFSAEHGIHAALEKSDIGNDTDAESGLAVQSIYGSTDAKRHPSAQQLVGLDGVVIDLQDVGVRYWTFQSLMGYFVEASAANNLDIIILDRPNPINGIAVEGPLITPGREDYVAPFDEPTRPGMTMGELAEMFNGEKNLGAHLTVIKMTGWHRRDWWDDAGLLWVNPSPNIRSLTQSLVYAGTALLEGTNVNVKGAIEPPFVRFGAPWIAGTQLAAYLNARNIPGVSFMAVSYVPAGEERYPYHGQRVEGVEVLVNDRAAVNAPELGVEAVSAIWKLYSNQFQIAKVDRLLLNAGVLEQIKAGEDPRQIAEAWQDDLARFRRIRAKYLLYE
jgi:uncharacterized protein YbbC (DUF1343 family)